MNRRTLGVTLLALGVTVLLVALAADLVGLGSGPRQVTGTVAGAVIAAAGVLLHAVR